MIIFHLSIRDSHFIRYHLQTCHFVKHKPVSLSQIKLKYLSEEDWLALTHRMGKDGKYQADLAKTTSLNDNEKACRKG